MTLSMDTSVERKGMMAFLRRTAAALSSVPMLVLLLQLSQPTEGADCPSRKAYVPYLTPGFPFPSSRLNVTADAIYAGKQLYWGWPSAFQEDCCSSGRIVNWTITLTAETQYIARVNATCTSGEQLSTPLYGYNGTSICPHDTNSSVTVYQPDDEGVFTLTSNSFVTTFMGVGVDPENMAPNVDSCPAGTRAIGVGARSGCHAILELQVLCANTNITQNNLGTALRRNTQPVCSAYSSLADDRTLVDPDLADIVSSTTYTDCCPRGEGIANWTIVRSYTTYGDYIGLIQGKCTDETLLAPVAYGFNGSSAVMCDQQRMSATYHYNTPKSQQYYYTTNNVPGTSVSNLLVSFIAPLTSNSKNNDQLSCPEGQGAVGYSASSSCYSLSNVSILCGNLSASAKESLDLYGSDEANPPTLGEAGVCPGGISMLPNGTFGPTIDAAYLPPINESRFNTGETLYRSVAGTQQAFCCPRGQAIVAFTVWAADNIQYMVGQVSAVCSAYTDGSNPTQTSAIGYGFNGTNVDGKTIFCPNATKDMRTVALENGAWNYSSSWDFQRLMDWPVRTEDNSYGYLFNTTTESCPSGQQPIAFTARSSCWGVADFRVICGIVTLQASPSTSTEATDQSDLNAAAKAGIAVGVFVVVALVAGFTLYKLHQNHKKRTRIESHQLFNLNGPAGFYPGIMTASRDSGGSSLDSSGAAKLVSMGLMTIENIDCSNDDTPVSFEGIPQEWEIKKDQIKLHCIDGKPIELGRGGFGVVLFGTVHKEDAAIKLIKGRSKENELLREIAILERAKTKYVVRFLGYSVCPDGILLAMEYMRGGTLWNALRDSEEFQWYNRGHQAFKDICRGLYMLHSNRIAHLDMKTPNVLIADDCTCKISDLGLGKLMKTEANTCTAETMGSFAWMGPEQIHGRCGFSSDIWALSTIIWELCTLRTPTREATPGDIDVPREAPQAVVDLMTACRQEDPRDRPGIGTICDLLDNMDGNTPPLTGHVSRYLRM